VNNGVKVQAAAFEFQDKLGRFTDFLIKMKCSIALSWTSKPYKYHIVVKSTTGDLYSEFSLENEEFKLVSPASFTLPELN
jgi:hypothetical protein